MYFSHFSTLTKRCLFFRISTRELGGVVPTGFCSGSFHIPGTSVPGLHMPPPSGSNLLGFFCPTACAVGFILAPPFDFAQDRLSRLNGITSLLFLFRAQKPIVVFYCVLASNAA
jgi:hypothetical protein